MVMRQLCGKSSRSTLARHSASGRQTARYSMPTRGIAASIGRNPSGSEQPDTGRAPGGLLMR